MPDREKVIKGLEYCMGGCQVSCFKCPYREIGHQPPDCLDNCMILQDAVELLKESASGWISVNDRLPEEKAWVLCLCRAGIREVLCWQNGQWYHDPKHAYFESFVLYWMVLPSTEGLNET